ncbi:MAG: hypothetical protein HWE22_13245 [Flavobacteriales bacterium]|nr:hypothetical protein [Flavobacteriales bacterium]
MKSTLNIFLGIWIVLFALFLPFTYSFFPNLGIDLTSSLSEITEWIASSVFGADIHSSPITSDSAAQFAQAFLLLFLAFPIAVLLRKQKRFSEIQVKQFLHTSAAYILAFFLLKYGVDKLFQFQFYAPEPNTLFTPLGMLSKDILFWSSMGTSSSYNTFMGLSEVIPGILLLHHRTRLLGGLIALGVLINVLAINFGFDITVKLLSSYLVIVAVFVLLPHLKNLTTFFLSESGSFTKPSLRLKLSSKLRLIVKTVVILLIFAEVLLSYFQIGSFNGREMEKIAHHGSYEVNEHNVSILGTSNVKRIHIHSKGYLILEDISGNFSDFPIWINSTGTIIAPNENMQVSVHHDNSTTLFGIKHDGEEQSVKCTEIDLDELPARNDSFHWTVDGMIPTHQEED